MQDNKAIYIMFSSTACGTGRFIRFMTHGFYNHVSVSFDEDLRELYSFARRYRRAPFYGGFVRESGMRYLLKPTPVKVCCINVTDEHYEKIRQKIDFMMQNKENYLYNLASAAIYPFRRKMRVLSAYTCVEFAAHLLDIIGLECSRNKSGFCTIKDLEELLSDRIVFEDIFPEADVEVSWLDDTYNEKLGAIGTLRCTLKTNALLVKRMLIRSDKINIDKG